DPPTRLAWVTPTAMVSYDVASGREARGGYPLPARLLGPGGNMRSNFGQTLGPGQTLVGRVSVVGQPPAWRAWGLGESAVALDVAMADVPEDVPGFRQNPIGTLAVAC